MMGDLDEEHPRAVRLAAETGCLVVSVDYRLAPSHPFPAAIEDSYTVLTWTVANATELGVDATRVGVVGSSAGGGLAAALALLARALQSRLESKS